MSSSSSSDAGVTLPYLRAGHGIPLLLVHGYLGGAEQWRAEIERFSSDYDVIAPNLPGFGAAAHLPGCNSVRAMAEAIHAFADELSLPPFVLLGHSMGGMIVQQMAALRPERVRALILYGTGPLGLMPDRFEPLSDSRRRLLEEGVPATIERIGAVWFRQGKDGRGYTHVTEIGRQANPEAALAAIDAMATWDGRPALPKLGMPTQIIWGDGDRSYLWPQVETLWRTLPDVRLSVIPGTSHATHLEKPTLFQGVVADFLAGIA